ncbi:MAG: alpha-amylase [Gemmatimonadota bacterium]|nr:alpha-amylase [Gemmatimonadota bacterium]
MTPPLLYNLFPRLVGAAPRWGEHARRAAGMGFNWLYLNPWHYPGFSGSLYAPKEFGRMNPLFLPPGFDPGSLDPLREALQEIQDAGLRPMMDLVVNHTARDSPLVEEHPEWYLRDDAGEVVSPFVLDPDDPSRRTVWGDLAEIDNRHSADRDRLWEFWGTRVREGLELGFHGFRCDAAAKVPAELWSFLIGEAARIRPGAEFFAETLGAPLEDVAGLRSAGFAYFFNSSKWWNFSEPWALDQHERFREIAPSIAFPESHDTPRLAAESGGDEAVQRQRYAFAAAFSAGVMMTTGYEFGFRTAVNVVETMPSDWERGSMDLVSFVTRVNRLKLGHPLLADEGVLRARSELQGETLILERSAAEDVDAPKGWIVINKVWAEGREVELTSILPPGAEETHRLFRVCRDDSPEAGEEISPRLTLDRAEVVYVLPRR